MLEYDDEVCRIYSSYYRRSYARGFLTGYLSAKFHIMRKFMKKYTNKQLLGIDAVEGDHSGLLNIWNEDGKEELLTFFHKYESLSDDQLVDRYIVESEYLPWR